MSRSGRLALVALGIILAGTAIPGRAAPDAQEHKPTVWDGNRTTPVHRIPLRDENDEPIIPTETNPLPFSARFTCGPCHDYGTVRGGWHFNPATAAGNGRPGEPWIWLDPKTGTILPLSYRRWPGIWDPKTVGLTAWDFTMLFGRHLPGGGPAEPSDEEVVAEPGARWNVSGRAEANCLACHNRSGRQDHSEWAKQILRENLRWAATAAGGVGEVGGMSSRLKSTWDVYDGPNLDDREWAVAPFVRYRTVDFDAKQRYFFDLDYQPADARCLACHSVSAAGEPRLRAEADVHSAAGLRCADCHRNDLGHDMIRGYEGESAETGNGTADSFTCRGCHLGEGAEGGRRVVPGRLGAPYPKHSGIPLVHFKRLACTVCHSGPVPKKGYTRVRTSRANRLGIYGVARWFTDLPAVVEPVYAKDASRKIAPHRLVWPAFWARMEGKDLTPLRPADVEKAAGDILNPEARIARVLNALAQVTAEDEAPVLASGRYLFAPNVDGGLDASESESEAAPGAGVSPWGLRKGSEVLPLIVDFDPSSPDKDQNIETRIQEYLQALGTVAGAPGTAAVLVRKTLYRIVDGNFDISEVADGFAGAPGAGWLRDGRLFPLADEFDVRTVTALAGTEQTLTEEQVALVLKALAGQAARDAGTGEAQAPVYLYLSGGLAFRLDKGRTLVATASEAAGPVTWPLAHGVRPAQQSLGRNGCTDCHSGGSDFFFTTLRGTGPLLTAEAEERSAASFMGLGGLFQRFFGLSFIVRPVFKVVLAVCAVFVGSLVFIVFLLTLGRLSGLVEKR